MSDIALSIIVPCYKVEQYLPACLDSLMAQTLDNIEVICINDGSPDSCIDILHRYERRYPSKIVIIDKKNEGVWRGRFDGIRLARGEYIGFVDSDDTVAPDFAETLYRTAADNDADISVCGFHRVDLETGKILSHEMCAERPTFDVIEEPGRLIELNGAPWNKAFRSSLLKNMRNLDEPPSVLDDLVFHLLVYLDCKGSIVFSPKSLINYMVREGSIINTVKSQQVDSIFNAFSTVASYYKEAGVSEIMEEALSSIAFLHLGVSLLFRLSYDSSADLGAYITRCTAFLNQTFPTWKHSSYTGLRYALQEKGAFLKLWIVRLFYKAHLMRPFLAVYRFVIDKLHIDIKW
ncbi:glycosyltransferase [uncultured Enorma sp.]|uniref:glycosyltransferase n=1 Tax=uncultured Enorma sp. TaxID=1714346 RepID=UPI0026DCD580|nr:glycosyltransferase [uncultured Enorma sp.]